MRLLYFAIGIAIGFCGADFIGSCNHMSDFHGAKPNTDDVVKLCRVVTHSSSDGYKYWSCDKIEKK